ncbi:PCD23 protein, partial [Ptilonorhynchus violaceus]|nr:PCD23 protein [Ptilonorhynchus violaceus]
LTVSARDGGGLTSATNAAVTVNILQTVLAPAIFERSRYTFSVPEDAPEDSPIGTVKAREPPNSLEVISYRISSGDPHGKFCIDPQFGIIRTKKQLDREAQSVVVLTVQSQLGNSPVYSSTQVNISVTDINDNPPVFLTKSDKVTISRTQPPGTAVYIAHAEDKDSGLNGAIKYRIASKQSNAFSIDPSLGVVNLTRSVFAEKQQEYTLHVAAEDCGSPPLTSLLMLDSLAVKVVILDVNDNSPNFMSSPLSYVMEDVEMGFLVHHIIAKDPDEGRNGQVTYHILSGNENKAFVLDKITGLLTTAQLLDREVQERYVLTVMALDDGSPARSATQVLTIIVLDVNDETPVFLKQLYKTAVHENQDPGEFVIKVEAVDRDAGLNSLLQYEILPGTGYEKFKMNSDSGELVTAASLDRETQEVFSIKGSPSRSSTAQLYLTVLDENDHSPLFAKTQYQISVTEDLEEGSAILDLSASDEDDGLNGEVMYSLIDNTYGAFTIDKVTGSIVTTKALDRETKSLYTFRAVASDCSTHLPRSTTVMTVLIQDVNDNVPKFEQSYHKALVWEGHSPETDIIQVFATDLDSGLNGEIEYSILSGNENATFLIDSARGILTTNTGLDYENTSSYRFVSASHQLVLLASDHGTPSLNSTATVLITVLDVNDNPPLFSSPEYHVHVKESIPIGSHITEVSAKDCDAGSNAEITYAIISGNDRGHFHLDGRTGSVNLMKMLDYEDTMKFTLIIQAT